MINIKIINPLILILKFNQKLRIQLCSANFWLANDHLWNPTTTSSHPADATPIAIHVPSALKRKSSVSDSIAIKREFLSSELCIILDQSILFGSVCDQMKSIKKIMISINCSWIWMRACESVTVCKKKLIIIHSWRQNKERRSSSQKMLLKLW